MKKIVSFFILVTFLSQCKNNYEFSEVKNINNTWLKTDTLKFNVKIKNPQEKKNINFIVRNNNEYPFMNIYFFVQIKKGDTIIQKMDTVNYNLSDVTGKWLGKGIGEVKEIYYRYKENFSFPKEGDYTISIVQGMRKDTLVGIEDFGVSIE